MNNIKLFSSILKRTNNLIKSEEYKESYKIGNSFSRKRKLSFSNTIYFICSALRRSLPIEITRFSEEHPYLDFPEISKQAFSKARQNISEEAFKELCRVFVDSFYSSNVELKKWNDFNIFAVDGTVLEVPDTAESIEYFGTSANQTKVKTAIATASSLYDVLNDVIIDANIAPYRTSERKMAQGHINSINNSKLLKKSIIIFDRGYPSYNMCDFLDKKNLFYVMRTPSSFKVTNNTILNDSIINFKRKGKSKEIRVIKVDLPDGTIETLITNIFDKNITIPLFKELYFLRWGIEGKYKELKDRVEIERFSGTKPIAIKQDFYASIYLAMVSSLVKKDADITIANANKEKCLQSEYQANRSFIFSEIFKKIIKIMVKPIWGRKELDKILKKAIKIRSQVRPNRSSERKNKHPRKKHHHNVKPCF